MHILIQIPEIKIKNKIQGPFYFTSHKADFKFLQHTYIALQNLCYMVTSSEGKLECIIENEMLRHELGLYPSFLKQRNLDFDKEILVNLKVMIMKDNKLLLTKWLDIQGIIK